MHVWKHGWNAEHGKKYHSGNIWLEATTSRLAGGGSKISGFVFTGNHKNCFLSHLQICFCPGSNLDLVLAGLGGQRVLVEVLEVGVEERLQEQG